jgi:hypothetical protein
VAGEPVPLRLAALDRFGNVDAGYAGRVVFVRPPGNIGPGIVFAPELVFAPADRGLKTVTGIGFPAVGTARVAGTATLPGGERAVVSNPTRVWPSRPGMRRFFGDTHFHTGSDVARLTTPGGDHRGQFVVSEDAYEYLRDVSSLDWGVTAEHDTGLSADTWEENKRRVDQAGRPGAFVSLRGYEWTPERRLGHHVVVFGPGGSGTDPLVGASSGRRGGKGVASVVELAAALRASGARALVIPHVMQPFPNGDEGREGHQLPHETWDGPPGSPPGVHVLNDLRRVGEIYSHHNDDFTPGDFRQTRDGASDQPQLFELGAENSWSFQHAWASGHRIGLVAGSDNHLGTPGMNNFAPTVQHHAGLAVVLAPELSREAVFDALYARRCYATTGPKIWLDFTVDGEPMGSELTRTPGAELDVFAFVAGTAPLDFVEVVALRDGRFETIAEDRESGVAFQKTIQTRVPFERATLLYVRVRQSDGEMAWSSPVWVDPS